MNRLLFGYEVVNVLDKYDPDYIEPEYRAEKMRRIAGRWTKLLQKLGRRPHDSHNR